MPLELGKKFKEAFDTSAGKLREGLGGALGYSEPMKKAEEKSTSEYSAGSQYQGEGDALRHILFSALATKAYGSDKPTKIMSYLNEYVKGALSESDDRDMDLTNDTIGREIGLKAKSEEEIFKLAKEAIESGKAKVLKKSPKEGETSEEMEARIKFEKDKADLDNM